VRDDTLISSIDSDVIPAEEDKQGDDGDEDEDDTMETRFVGRLLEVLFKGFVAKDKSVRYRSVFLVAEMVAHMGELECVPFVLSI
jgi:condensin complex subunit 3